MKKAKVVLVGSASAGKTSIVNRYIFKDFTQNTITTTQPGFVQKLLVYNDIDICLEIWDTAGQEKYHALTPIFYRNADIGVVVFDLTSAESFEAAQRWVSELQQNRGNRIRIIIVGNKSDLRDDRIVPIDDAQEYANTQKFPYVEVSAKNGNCVEYLFQKACELVITRLETAPPDEEEKEAPAPQLKKDDSSCC